LDGKVGFVVPREMKNLEYFLAHFLELPKELVMGLPRITVLGDIQMIVENHRGIIEYTMEKVRIGTSIGELWVTGTGLVLRTIFPEEISVDGKIRSITLINEK
jgi:sporulation protein YqfC